MTECTPGLMDNNPYLPMPMVIKQITDEVDDRTIKSFDLDFKRPEDAQRFHYTSCQFC